MGYKVLKFTATWCMPCRLLDKEIDEIKDEYDFELESIDIERNPDMALKYSVTTVPTVVILKDGIPIDRVNGYSNLSDFKRWLTSHVPKKSE